MRKQKRRVPQPESRLNCAGVFMSGRSLVKGRMDRRDIRSDTGYRRFQS